MKTLKDLYEHQLKDLYSAEDQLCDAIPKMKSNVSDTKLKNTFEDYLSHTKETKSRIENICNEMGVSPTGEKCNAMEGLIQEAEGFINEAAEQDVKDAGLIADAQRIAHYEIAGYGTAVRYARELGKDSVADKLQSTLNKKYDFNEQLNKMAQQRLNQEAIA